MYCEIKSILLRRLQTDLQLYDIQKNRIPKGIWKWMVSQIQGEEEIRTGELRGFLGKEHYSLLCFSHGDSRLFTFQKSIELSALWNLIVCKLDSTLKESQKGTQNVMNHTNHTAGVKQHHWRALGREIQPGVTPKMGGILRAHHIQSPQLLVFTSALQLIKLYPTESRKIIPRYYPQRLNLNH